MHGSSAMRTQPGLRPAQHEAGHKGSIFCRSRKGRIERERVGKRVLRATWNEECMSVVMKVITCAFVIGEKI